MLSKIKFFLATSMAAVIIVLLIFFYPYGDTETLTDEQMIAQHIARKMKDGNIPGLAITVIKNGEMIVQEGFGYEDLATLRRVDQFSLFELGSVSKSFTGYAINLLVADEKIALDDCVSKYLPWFHVRYQQEEVELTIRDLLYQTSGIPFFTIKDIPINNSDNALFETVRSLVDIELEEYPGKKFQYATINYDILGLIIQEVSNMSYEHFMKEYVFSPFGMEQTFAGKGDSFLPAHISTGYKMGFFLPREFNAPIYRGNTPAGYIISNLNDMTIWIQTFMNQKNWDEYEQSIAMSLLVNRQVPPTDEKSSYASGWYHFQLGNGEYSHGGGNPNFSTYIAIRPEDQTGVVILTNIGGIGGYVDSIGKGVMDILENRQQVSNKSEMVSLDYFSSIVTIISLFLSFLLIIFIVRYFIKLIQNKRKNFHFNVPVIFTCIIIYILVVMAFYYYPNVFYNGLDWYFLCVWAPKSLTVAAISLLVFIFLYLFYYILYASWVNEHLIPYFLLVSFSIISGIGNALVIFMINTSLKVEHPIQKGMLWYFILGLVMYMLSQKIIREKLSHITKNNIYSIRLDIIETLLNKPYESFERLDDGEVRAILHHDTEKFSEFPNVFVDLITTIVTIVLCFLYLGTINQYGLMFIIVIILLVVGIYALKIEEANRLLELSRDIQEQFFVFIDSLICGMKELQLNIKKMLEFKSDMDFSFREYRDRGIQVEKKFTSLMIIGEIIFTCVLGIVAFLIPEIFKNFRKSDIATFIFVLIYITGPIRNLLSNIPRFLSINVSKKRIYHLIKAYKSDEKKADPIRIHKEAKPITRIVLNNISFSFHEENKFSLGPLSLTFELGETIFIVGGNGSGKTTLIKLLANLYQPQSGTILGYTEGGEAITLTDQVSPVFYDYYLFHKLYGVDLLEMKDNVFNYLSDFKLSEKVRIENNTFSTIKLSSGQRKRLALLQACLENKTIFIFDEVAADQDPEFKKYYYEVFLKDLAERKKIVIIVTHDDHYYHLADKIIKLEHGKVQSVVTKK